MKSTIKKSTEVVPCCYVFYDEETKSRSGQINQFASVTTDSNFNIKQVDELFCKDSPDLIPEVAAFLVHHIPLSKSHNEGLTEHEFASRIKNIKMNNSQSCIIGYNNVSFDDERFREACFRTMLDPYDHLYFRGNMRVDLFHITQCFYAVCPESIIFPKKEDGKISLKLEHLATANGITQDNAHNAVDDVKATVDFAKLLKEKNPKLFNFCISLTDKNIVSQYIKKPFIYIDKFVSRDKHHITAMMPLFQNPKNKNSTVCLDLIQNSDDVIDKILKTPIKDLDKYLFTKSNDEKIYIREIKINQHPMVMPLAVLKNKPDMAKRAGVSYDEVIEKFNTFLNNPKLREVNYKLGSYYKDREFPPKELYASIYDNFFSQKDREFMSSMRHDNYSEWIEKAKMISDKRVLPLAIRAVGNVDINLLDDDSKKEYEKWMRESYNDKDEKYGCSLPRFWSECQDVFDDKERTPEEKSMIRELFVRYNHFAEKYAPDLFYNMSSEINEYRVKKTAIEEEKKVENDISEKIPLKNSSKGLSM